MPVSKMDIKGRLEKEFEINFAKFIRSIPNKNQKINSKTIPTKRR